VLNNNKNDSVSINWLTEREGGREIGVFEPTWCCVSRCNVGCREEVQGVPQREQASVFFVNFYYLGCPRWSLIGRLGCRKIVFCSLRVTWSKKGWETLIYELALTDCTGGWHEHTTFIESFSRTWILSKHFFGAFPRPDVSYLNRILILERILIRSQSSELVFFFNA